MILEITKSIMGWLIMGVIFMLVMVMLWMAIMMAMIIVRDLYKEYKGENNDNKE